MRFVNDRERVLVLRCLATGQTLHFRFTRRVFRAEPGALPCPACGKDYAGLAHDLAEAHGLGGWRVELLSGSGPAGHDIPSAYGQLA